MNTIPCPMCHGTATISVHQSQGAFFANVEEGSIPFTLDLCQGCGFVYQSSAYQQGYQTLTEQVYAGYDVNKIFPFPDRSEKNSSPLDRILAHRPNKANPSILEIGSSRGDLLYLLREAIPTANIIGIDPTAFKDLAVPTLHGTFRADLFSHRFDIIIMKHVLEHIPFPRKIVADLDACLHPEGILYIEVPDLELSLTHGAEDFVPDHVSYFTPETLANCLSSFKIIHQDRSTFLSVIAVKTETTEPKSQFAATSVAALQQRFIQFDTEKKRLVQVILRLARDGIPIIFYGISYYFSRMFKELTNLGLPQQVCFYFDDNYHGETEPNFGLPRCPLMSGNSQTGALVVLCSNNFRVQEKMVARLIGLGCRARLLRPWLGIDINNLNFHTSQ